MNDPKWASCKGVVGVGGGGAWLGLCSGFGRYPALAWLTLYTEAFGGRANFGEALGGIP